MTLNEPRHFEAEYALPILLHLLVSPIVEQRDVNATDIDTGSTAVQFDWLPWGRPVKKISIPLSSIRSPVRRVLQRETNLMTATIKNTAEETAIRPFVFARTFDATREEMWKAQKGK